MRINYYKFPEGTNLQVRIDNDCTKNYDTGEILDVVECISVTTAKLLLKKYGGCAWTEHTDREGRLFEVTEIRAGKNNSRFKYNHHL